MIREEGSAKSDFMKEEKIVIATIEKSIVRQMAGMKGCAKKERENLAICIQSFRLQLPLIREVILKEDKING
jgi:hypothetical protein